MYCTDKCSYILALQCDVSSLVASLKIGNAVITVNRLVCFLYFLQKIINMAPHKYNCSIFMVTVLSCA